jgi:penicillin amidase
MPELQRDTVSVLARELAAHFTAFEAHDERARRMQAILEGWDGSMEAGSAAGAVCAVARERLAALTVDRYYAAVDGIPAMQPQDHTILLGQLSHGSALMLGEFDSWDAAIEQALVETSEELSERQGNDPARWRWSSEHKMVWQHNLGRDPELTDTFNLPPLEMLGDRTTVWNAGTPVGATGMHGVTYRQILDVGDLNAARICIPPGNSGQPGSPHYGDHVDDWLNVTYHPMFVDWSDITKNTEAELRLSPA